MERQDSRTAGQLASLLGSPVIGGVVGGVTAPERKVSTGLGTGLGAAGGALGGSILGAGAGGALGYGGGAVLSKLLEEDGVFGAGDDIRVGGALLGSQLGALLGSGAGAWKGSGAGHDYMQKESSTMSQEQEVNHAFAIGALEKMAEYGVDPQRFVEAAEQTGDPTMCKVASAVIDLDSAIRREKLAARQKTANPLAKLVQEAKAVPSRAGDALEGLRSAKKLQQQGSQAVEFGQNAAQMNRGETADLAGELAGKRFGEADMMRQLAKEQGLAAARGAAAPAALVGGGGAAAAYGAGDADTTSNKIKNMANKNLGTDFDTQSRAGAGIEKLRELLGR